MLISFVLISFAFGGGALFYVTRFLRSADNPEKLLKRIQPRYQTLMELVAEIDDEDDERLWKAIGGRRGLWRLFRDSMTLVTLLHAKGIPERDPEEYDLNARRAEMVLICNAGALVDDLWRQLGFAVGRNYARTAALNYWNLMLSTQIVIQEFCPEMLDRLESSL